MPPFPSFQWGEKILKSCQVANLTPRGFLSWCVFFSSSFFSLKEGLKRTCLFLQRKLWETLKGIFWGEWSSQFILSSANKLFTLSCWILNDTDFLDPFLLFLGLHQYWYSESTSLVVWLDLMLLYKDQCQAVHSEATKTWTLHCFLLCPCCSVIPRPTSRHFVTVLLIWLMLDIGHILLLPLLGLQTLM